MNAVKKYFIFIGIILLGFGSCKDFLDVKPKGEIIPEKLVDFEMMFNGTILTNLVSAEMEYATDEVYRTYGREDDRIEANIYLWRKDLDNDIVASPQVWLARYKTIYFSNFLVNNVMSAIDGSQAEKENLIAQAKAIRATSYFNLLTVFSKAANLDQNPDDLGLPLVTSTNVTDVVPQRSTIKETVDYMIKDLTEAIAHLPEQHQDRWRVSKYGAAGMLSRLYLYVHDYPKAYEYATLALNRPGEQKMLNYNTIAAYPTPNVNVERIWIDFTNVASGATYSKDQQAMYTPEDLRLALLTSASRTRKPNTGTGVSMPEMYLTQAECLARDNKADEALAIINMIRENRLPTDDPNIVLTASNAEEALTHVLDERRRELAFYGTRWMDMKRLDYEGKMPAVNRYMGNNPANEVLVTLSPKSDSYTFEIPLKVQYINPTLKRNY